MVEVGGNDIDAICGGEKTNLHAISDILLPGSLNTNAETSPYAGLGYRHDRDLPRPDFRRVSDGVGNESNR